MKEQDEIGTASKQHWESMVQERCEFTRPWLNLDRDLIRQYARGELTSAPEPLIEIYPASVLTNVSGKDVLCLASGGGQQSALFALLGARVTVVDLAQGQLKGDRQAAAHYGYQVTTIQADMRDLSQIKAESLIWSIKRPQWLMFLMSGRYMVKLLGSCGLREYIECNIPIRRPSSWTSMTGMGKGTASPDPMQKESDAAKMVP